MRHVCPRAATVTLRYLGATGATISDLAYARGKLYHPLYTVTIKQGLLALSVYVTSTALIFILYTYFYLM